MKLSTRKPEPCLVMPRPPNVHIIKHALLPIFYWKSLLHRYSLSSFCSVLIESEQGERRAKSRFASPPMTTTVMDEVSNICRTKLQPVSFSMSFNTHRIQEPLRPRLETLLHRLTTNLHQFEHRHSVNTAHATTPTGELGIPSALLSINQRGPE
ncbi:hypothetical protein BDP67DRAFT_528063 [Colletotrichum lupini]|nr:hypothetical protein BDP67DRAFT_528063 [Colletotrichum lupini]